MSLLDTSTNADHIGDAELYQTRRNMCIDPLKNPDLASHPLVSDGTLINDIKEPPPPKPSLRLSSLGHRNLINYPMPNDVKPDSVKIKENDGTELCFYCDAVPKRGTTLCEPCERYFCGKHSAKHRHNCKGGNKKIISAIKPPMSLNNPEKDIEMNSRASPSSGDEDNNNDEKEYGEDDDVVLIIPKISEDANDVNMKSEEEEEEEEISSEEEEKENFKGGEISRLVEYTEQLQFDKDQCDFQRKVRNHYQRTGYKPKNLEEATERKQEEAEAFITFRAKRKKKRLQKEKKLNGKRPKRKCLKNIDLKDPLKEYQDTITSHWDPDYNDNDSGMDSEEERISTQIAVDLTRDLSDPSSREEEEEEEEESDDEENMANRCYDTKTGKSSKMPDEPEPDSEPEDGISTSRKRKSSSSKPTPFKIPTDLIMPPVALTLGLLGKALKPDKQGSCTETPWLPEKGKSVLTSVPRKILPNVEGISLSDLKKKSLRKRIEAALEHRIHRAESAINRAKKKIDSLKHKIDKVKQSGQELDEKTLSLISLSKQTPFNQGIIDLIKYNVGWVLHASVKDENIIWAYAVVAVNTPKENNLAYKLVIVPLGLLKLIFPARVPCFKAGIAVARSLMIDSNIGHHIASDLWMPHWNAMHETSKTHKQGSGCLVTSWPTRNSSTDGKQEKRYLPTLDSRLLWTHMRSNPFGSIKVKVCSLVDLTSNPSSSHESSPPKKKQKTSKTKVIKKEKEKVKKEEAEAEEPKKHIAVAPVIITTTKKVNNLELKTIFSLLEFADFDSTNVNMSNQQLCDHTVDSNRIMTTSPQAIGLYLEANMIMKTNLKRKAPPLNSLKTDTMIAMGNVPEKGKTQSGEKIVPAGAQTVRASIIAQKHVRRIKAKAAIEKRKGTHIPPQRRPHKEKGDSKAAILAEAAVLAAEVMPETVVKPPPKKKVKKEHRPVSEKQLETSLMKASYGKCHDDWWKQREEQYFTDFCGDPLVRALKMAQQKGELAKLLLNRLQIQSGGLSDLLGKICETIDTMKNQTSQTDVRSIFLKILETYFGIKNAARGMICGLVLVQRAYGIKDSTDEKKEPEEEEMDDFMLSMLGNGDLKDVPESNPKRDEMSYIGAMLLIMHESIVKSRISKGVDRDQSMAFFEKCKAWIQTDLDVHGEDGFGLNLLARSRNGETDPIILSLVWLMIAHGDNHQ